MAMMCATRVAPSCRDCGTTGGYIERDSHVPKRARGLCSVCYDRHYNDGTFKTYPKTGPVPPYGRDVSIPSEVLSPAALRSRIGLAPGTPILVPSRETQSEMQTRFDAIARRGGNRYASWARTLEDINAS